MRIVFFSSLLYSLEFRRHEFFCLFVRRFTMLWFCFSLFIYFSFAITDEFMFFFRHIYYYYACLLYAFTFYMPRHAATPYIFLPVSRHAEACRDGCCYSFSRRLFAFSAYIFFRVHCLLRRLLVCRRVWCLPPCHIVVFPAYYYSPRARVAWEKRERGDEVREELQRKRWERERREREETEREKVRHRWVRWERKRAWEHLLKVCVRRGRRKCPAPACLPGHWPLRPSWAQACAEEREKRERESESAMRGEAEEKRDREVSERAQKFIHEPTSSYTPHIIRLCPFLHYVYIIYIHYCPPPYFQRASYYITYTTLEETERAHASMSFHIV